MTTTIATHWTAGPDAERFASILREEAAESIDELEESPGTIASAFGDSVQYMQAQCTVDPSARLGVTWESVVAAEQVGAAMFAVTGRTEGVVECRIDHKIRHLPAIGPSTFPNAGQWLTAFWLAVVCRDRDRLTLLCAFPMDQLRSAQGQVDEFTYLWIDTLQTYWRGQPDVVEKLTATIEASYPDVATLTPRDQMEQILYQPVNLFYNYVRNNRAEFNEALAEALEMHRQYWAADEDRARKSSGRIALGPLAVACLAYDDEFPIEVESDYIPINLVQRTWLGEFEV